MLWTIALFYYVKAAIAKLNRLISHHQYTYPKSPAPHRRLLYTVRQSSINNPAARLNTAALCVTILFPRQRAIATANRVVIVRACLLGR